MRARNRLVPAPLAVMLVALPAPGARAQTPAAPPPVAQGALVAGRPASGRLDAPGAHRWTVELAAGEYAEVEVAQRGVDLSVKVLGAADSLRASFDGSWALQGTELARWIADAPARFTIELAPYPPTATGAYEIRWTVRRAASATDREVVRSDSLYQTGKLLARRGRYADAEPLLRRALDLRSHLLGAEHRDVGEALNELGALQYRQGRYGDAEPLWRRALEVRERALGGGDPMVGLSESNLAVLLMRQGRYAEAEALHGRALAVREGAYGARHPDVAASLQNLATVYIRQGRYAEAESTLRRAIPVWESTVGPEDPDLAETLSNLASTYDFQGRFAEAEPLYRRALAIHEKAYGPEHAITLLTLSNLGTLYVGQRRYADAEAALRRALAAAEKSLGGEHPTVAQNLDNLALVYKEQPGRVAEAEALVRRSLAIREKVYGAAHPEVADALTNLALFRHLQTRHGEAESLQRRALAIREAALGPAHPLVARNLAGVAEELLDAGGRSAAASAAARPLLDRAVAILDAGRGYTDDRVAAYALRARARHDAGDRAGALADLAAAIGHAEAQRPRVGGGEETRATFFGRYAGYFDRMVAWQLDAGSVAGALEYAERGRARVLLDQLAAARVDVREGIPADVRAPLEARERGARARVAEYQSRLTLLRARRDVGEAVRDRQGAVLEDSLRAADRDLADADEELRGASPAWRALLAAGGRPVPLDTIQRRLVPARGYLLVYHVGDEGGSTLFLVPPAGARPRAVPLRVGAAEGAALGMTPGPLTATALAAATASLAASLGESPRTPGAAPAAATLARLHALRRVLVPEALWPQVRAASEVVVVPGRGLYLLPFEALVVERAATADRARFWLDDGPSVRYAASATTLYNIERLPRAADAAAAASVLSLSNPVFDPVELTRQAAAAGSAARPVADVAGPTTRAGYLDAGGVLAPLPATAAETEAIRRAFGTPGGRDAVTALQGAEATEARLRASLGGKRYLHLATHAVVDEQRAALFAALALTPAAAGGTPTADDDGFLQLYEVYQLRLAGVELAVLSACRTNAGAAVEGEGVFALARGFHAAGARRVVGSEWAVEDRSTAALMQGLFAGIAAAGRGGAARVDYAAALREAKRAVRRQARWAHPYYWAPFVLTGAR